MMKKKPVKFRLPVCLLLALALLAAAPLAASAQGQYPDWGITVTVNGDRVAFPDQYPVLVNDRTYVPVRFVAEKMLADVEWYQDAQTAVVSRNGVDIALQIGNATMTVSERGAVSQIQMDAAPFLLNDRTLLPIRFVVEALGGDVGWNGANRVVIIEDDYVYAIEHTEDIDVTVQAPGAPVANPGEGTYEQKTLTVELKSPTTSADIYYTTNGTSPTENSTRYWGGIELGEGTTTIRAIAVNAAGIHSKAVSFHYTVSPPASGVEVPTLVGLSESNAVAALNKVGLKVVRGETYSATVKAGNVISQTPVAKTLVTAGSAVTIQISMGPAYPVTISKKATSTALTTVTLASGDTLELAASTQLSYATITWSSSNSSVAIVSTNGVVTAVGAGECVITASNGSNEDWDGEIGVIVQARQIPATGLEITSYPMTMQVGESAMIVCAVTPLDATDKALNWMSSNSAILSVDSVGTVRALQPGTATVTVALANGRATRQVIIAVEAPPATEPPPTEPPATEPPIVEDPSLSISASESSSYSLSASIAYSW